MCLFWLFLLTNNDSCILLHSLAKFLIDHKGVPLRRFHGYDPFDMKDDIEALLKRKEEEEGDVAPS
jgi:hypothetical protein